MIDASIPYRAGLAGMVDMNAIYQQNDQRKAQEQAMQMRQQEMDWQKQLHADAQDEAKRKAIKEGLADMAAAVQWADTPEKWAQVTQHYAQYDPTLASVPFEDRERALIQLGQMGEFLKGIKGEIITPEAGQGAYRYDPRTRKVETLIAPNPGTAVTGSASNVPHRAIDALRANPSLADDFQRKYGVDPHQFLGGPAATPGTFPQ